MVTYKLNGMYREKIMNDIDILKALLVLCLNFIEEIENMYKNNEISLEEYQEMIKIKLEFINKFR